MHQRHKNMRMKQLTPVPALAAAAGILRHGSRRRKDLKARLSEAQAPKLRPGHFVNLTV